MRRTRKILALMIIAILSITLIGCANTETADTNNTSESAATLETVDNHSYHLGQTADKSKTDIIDVTTTESVVEPVADNTDTDEIANTLKEEPLYSITDMSQTMYATSSVNVRDFPSVDGNKIGELSCNQAVTVLGQCNETSWYEIEYNDSVGFVNNKYLSTEAKSANAGASSGSRSRRKANFPKEKAMAVLDLINAERTANGVGQLVWDENMYNYACVRAQQITANFEHDYASPYGENIGYMPYIQTANDVHTQYYNSPGHHQNYLTGSYVAGAVAIYEVDGVSYHVELFSTTTGNSYGNTAAQQSAEAQEWGATVVATWTASNDIVFEILSDGNVGIHYGRYSDEQINAALAEFMNYMEFQY